MRQQARVGRCQILSPGALISFVMTLVFRCWRERVEHDAAGINNDSSRWRVRKQTARQRRAGPRTRAHDGGQRRPSPSAISDEKRFADGQLRNFTQFAETYKWSPWQEGGAGTAEAVRDDDSGPAQHTVDETQLQRWRLKCDLKRVATFYRVTGSQAKAEARKRSARTRARSTCGCRSSPRARARRGASGGPPGTRARADVRSPSRRAAASARPSCTSRCVVRVQLI